MPGPLRTFARWLHTGWPAGTTEKLPEVNADGSTNVPGLSITGDLTGIPLLKFAADSGARVVARVAADPKFQRAQKADAQGEHLDLVIVGAGVSGMSAALEARKRGLSFTVLEANEPFSTVVNFPKGKRIYTYPTEMTPAGELAITAGVKEALVAELEAQTLAAGITPRKVRARKVVRRRAVLEVVLADGSCLLARHVIVAIGRSGSFRRLGVPGEDRRDKVFNRLHDPKDFCGRRVLVVGGGDAALETAIALTGCGTEVALAYRKSSFSRPKPENIAALEALARDPQADVAVEEPVSERVTTATGRWLRGALDPPARRQSRLTLLMGHQVTAIEDDAVVLTDPSGKSVRRPNDAVFLMIGREAPLGFFRASGVKIKGEVRGLSLVLTTLFFLVVIGFYNWKTHGTRLAHAFEANGWFPFNIPRLLDGLGAGIVASVNDPTTWLGTIAISAQSPGFYYSLAYCVLVVVFGVRRIRRRRTPYVTLQTLALMVIQVVPLFLLPYLLLPYAGHNGAFGPDAIGPEAVAAVQASSAPESETLAATFADEFFPRNASEAQGREYWRAFGFVLAWPLMVWNVFTSQPLMGWLIVAVVQTFVLIPLLVWRFGKGAYCGWICSCGALAETLGDTHRHKMPHGPRANRLNLMGQAIMLVAFVLLGLRIWSWADPTSVAGTAFAAALSGFSIAGVPANYYWIVDVLIAGILGVGLYFWFSGRVWCRFACPLAALMHLYARAFSRFRIFADKSKCISCNACTATCHQGIDVMNFANKGLPMADPQCVRCSACVQVCPTGVLRFGVLDPKTGEAKRTGWLAASRVQIAEHRPTPVLGGAGNPAGAAARRETGR